jgi:hypothetical protein
MTAEQASQVEDIKSRLRSESAEPTNVLGLAMTSAVQFSYITNDTVGAISYFESLGIGPWTEIEGAATVRVHFAFMTGRTYELVEPTREPALVEDEALIEAERAIFVPPAGGDLSVRFHHVGAFLPVATQTVLDAAAQADLRVRRTSNPGAPGDVVFVDTRATLGHWLKVLCTGAVDHQLAS